MVLLGSSQQHIDVTRQLITSRGEVIFVPVPANTTVAPGDPVPDVQPLFGAEGVASVELLENQVGQPAAEISLTPAAAARFRAHTGAHIGEQFAIGLDGIVLLAPMINAEIDGEMQISGAFDEDVAALLAAMLSRPQAPGGIEELSFAEFAAPGC